MQEKCTSISSASWVQLHFCKLVRRLRHFDGELDLLHFYSSSYYSRLEFAAMYQHFICVVHKCCVTLLLEVLSWHLWDVLDGSLGGRGRRCLLSHYGQWMWDWRCEWSIPYSLWRVWNVWGTKKARWRLEFSQSQAQGCHAEEEKLNIKWTNNYDWDSWRKKLRECKHSH